MTVTNEMIDSLLVGYKKPEDLIGENGLLKLLTKKLVERALQAEMVEHLGHAKNETVANVAGNTRNGKSKKTLKGVLGAHGAPQPELCELEIAQGDRCGSQDHLRRGHSSRGSHSAAGV